MSIDENKNYLRSLFPHQIIPTTDNILSTRSFDYTFLKIVDLILHIRRCKCCVLGT